MTGNVELFRVYSEEQPSEAAVALFIKHVNNEDEGENIFTFAKPQSRYRGEIADIHGYNIRQGSSLGRASTACQASTG